MASPDAPRDAEIERARTFARVFDDYGLDPLLGFLLPGVGDLIGSVFGLYLVSIALRRKVSKVVIARMLMNLSLDALVGVVPIAGDIADVLMKANDKNLKLIEDRHLDGKARASDWLVLLGAAAAFLAAIGLVIYGAVRLVRWLF